MYGLDNGTLGQLKLSRASFGDERFTDLDFVDNTDIFEEPVEVLVSSLDVLSKLSEILGLRVSWEK